MTSQERFMAANGCGWLMLAALVVFIVVGTAAAVRAGAL